MFVLFTFIVEIVLAIIDAIIGTYNTAIGMGLLSGLFYLAILVPSIALNTRRLHDIGKSGWFQLLFIIPIVGFILWIIWMVRDGDDGVNQYGPSPKAPVGYYGGGAAPA